MKSDLAISITDFPSIKEYNQFLADKLAHYNKWLADPKREFSSIYPGYPGESKILKGKKKMESKAIADIASTLTNTKAAPAAAKPKAKRMSTGPKAGTKSQLASDIYKRLNGDKASVIAAIQDELHMSLAGATTYFYNAKKAC